ncbi:uncharacterized protein K460DRAFT_404836 [Cucurbitaria berberidis CBS 394.84]|uniref:RING-type domain-containing protein n=1 Tax=Cucurbitaria berberidis CBS 394.84 TaxID=1168544 RepID=A0A9P4GEI6_9PLEO|nr:uncharacterized protein K460DRAFT_404836 [Cucurbitaria berberidis CBS 394.84]KAF1844543.1 hypothetical protein K460DRAFT_404836 [Cucurbitaria berberidis CBS 394.84]
MSTSSINMGRPILRPAVHTAIHRPRVDANLPSRDSFIANQINVTTECSLCYEGFDENHAPARITGPMACNHVFGATCLRDWLMSDHPNANTCPMCRATLFRGEETRQEHHRRGYHIDEDNEEEFGFDEYYFQDYDEGTPYFREYDEEESYPWDYDTEEESESESESESEGESDIEQDGDDASDDGTAVTNEVDAHLSINEGGKTS